MKNITITQHAVERFVERSLKLGMKPPINPENTIRKLLNNAQPEMMDPVYKVKRIINNRCKAADYYVANGWRFVVSTENKELMTIERVNKEQN